MDIVEKMWILLRKCGYFLVVLSESIWCSVESTHHADIYLVYLDEFCFLKSYKIIES